MITPALLILASGSLVATVLVRLARVVDRIRKLAEGDPQQLRQDDVERHQRRAWLSERALLFFFSAITCFVIAGFSIAIDRAMDNGIWWLPVGITTIGMALIVAGCAAMIGETRLSMEQLRLEISRLRI